MQIDIHLVAPRISEVRKIEDWACGCVVSCVREPDRMHTAVQATRPWVGSAAAVLDPKRVEAALTDFVNLKPQDNQQAIDFMQAYGLFNDGDRASMNGHPSEVKKRWGELERAGKVAFATDLRSFWYFQERIVTLLTLSRSRGRRNLAAVREASKKINPYVNLKNVGDLADFGEKLLSYQVSQGLAQVNLGIIPIRRQMIAVATAVDVRSALYFALLSYLTRGARLKDCANSACGRVFLVTRPDRKFCRVQCQNLVKVKRYRRRQKAAARPDS